MNRFIVCLLQITFLFSTPSFGAEIREVSILDIHPTQPAAGYSAVEAAQAIKYKNINDPNFFSDQVLQEKPLRGVIGPDAELYLTDGHHRALGILRASSSVCEKKQPLSPVDSCVRGTKVRVVIDMDYSQKTWPDFVDSLQKDNNIYLPPELRQKLSSGEISPEQLFKRPDGLLPANLGKLANDPMRSALGTLFYYQGISGELFVNYVEFLLSEKLDKNIRVKPGEESDMRVQLRLMKAIFCNDQVVNFLRCLAKRETSTWQKAQKQINLAVGLEEEIPFDASHCNSIQ